MPGFSSYIMANEILNFYYRGIAIDIDATLYMRLLVSPSNRAGGGTETDYAGYARKAFTRNTSSIWTIAPSNGLLVNGVKLTFGVATTAGNGDLVSFDFVDTPSGAFTKSYDGGPILPAVAIVVNKAPEFDVGKLQISR